MPVQPSVDALGNESQGVTVATGNSTQDPPSPLWQVVKYVDNRLAFYLEIYLEINNEK